MTLPGLELPTVTPVSDVRDVLAPLRDVRFVDRTLLSANDYNPNKVSEDNLQLLQQSILANGWTMPIVCRADLTIIDGFHRWTLAGRDPLLSLLDGKVPVVIVDHDSQAANVYGTITHNRARGVHLLEPMKVIVRELLADGKDIEEISRETGMRAEEVFRLAGLSRDEFLKRMIGDAQVYSPAEHIVKRPRGK